MDFQNVIIIASAIGRYLELINCQSVSDCKQLFTMENGKISYLSVLNELFGLWATMSTSDRKTMACILHSLITTENLAALVKLLVADESGEISMEKTRAIEIGISKNQGLQRAFDYYHDICSAVKVEVSDIPKRNYQKKQALKIVLPKASDEIRTTIAIMLNEIFRSTYSNMTDYLAAVTSGTNESKDIPEGVLQGLTGEIDESAIYIFEDSQIDMGLLTSVERNLTRFFELIYDYCDWLIEGQQEEQYPDNSSEDESVENEAEESQIYAHTFEGDSGEENVTKNEENDTQEAQLCYLKFGYSEYSRMVQVEQTGQYLKSLGFDQNAYTATRKKKIKICLDGKGHMCDFCGRELSNDSYQVLKDGRERCSKCSETVLHTLEEYEKLFEKVFHDMEIYYGIKLNPKIRVKVVDTSVVQRAFKKKWRPTSGHDSRVIGYANSQGTKIVLENGAPRPKLVETIVHELTHIWQFDNCNYRELHKRYPTDEGMRDVEEGMAQWTCIQYMYLSGYEEYMDARLPLELNRDDEYGRGLRMFVKRYPLQKKRSLWGNTPFKNPDNPV